MIDVEVKRYIIHTCNDYVVSTAQYYLGWFDLTKS